jgi:hypothetical protein
MLKSDDPTEEGQLCCGTAYATAREMRMAEISDYAPYAAYLNAQREGQLPSGWSKKGKAVLQGIISGTVRQPVIPPVGVTEWLKYHWYKRCRADPRNKLAAKAALLVVQRSDDFLMIPAYDFYNHRNGKWLNTQTVTTEGTHHITKATRTIEPGEELYISYNMCNECAGRRFGYGTAGKFFRYQMVSVAQLVVDTHCLSIHSCTQKSFATTGLWSLCLNAGIIRKKTTNLTWTRTNMEN